MRNLKRYFVLAIFLVASAAPVFSQNAQGGQRSRTPQPAAGGEGEKDLPRFDLNFPGGTPQDLVDAIRKEIGTLNAIIPEKDRNVRLPSFQVNSVNVAELFRAMQMASQGFVTYQTGSVEVGGGKRSVLQQASVSHGFQTQGVPTRDSVWFFSSNGTIPMQDPTVCRFYQLAPYLGTVKVDDITTAVQAGWKMLGESQIPQLNYHEDTKLLIAVGPQQKLEMIDAVLAELAKAKSETAPKEGTAGTKEKQTGTSSK